MFAFLGFNCRPSRDDFVTFLLIPLKLGAYEKLYCILFMTESLKNYNLIFLFRIRPFRLDIIISNYFIHLECNKESIHVRSLE